MAAPAAVAANAVASSHVSSALLQVAVRSPHEAAILLLLHQLSHASVAAVRWLLPTGEPASNWNESKVSYRLTMVSSGGGAALRLLFVPLFHSLVVRPTLHLVPQASGLLLADPAALKAAMQVSSPVDAPPLTIADVTALWSREAKQRLDASAQSPCTLASLPAEALAAAQERMRALVFEPQAGQSHSFCGQLASLRTRAAQQSIDSQLFSNYIHRVLDGLHAAPSGADSSATATPALAQDAGAVESVSLLAFPSEKVVTTQSAFLALIHLLLTYEGFRPCEGPADSTGAAIAPPAVHFMPVGWPAFTSSQSVFALSYQHVSLLGVLPRHEVRFKVASIFGETVVVHAQFLPDALAAAAAQAAPKSETKEADVSMADAAGTPTPTTSPPANSATIHAGKIYSISLRFADFIQQSILGHAPPPTSDPAALFKRVGSLLTQYRNRVLKHMLGEEYRNAVNNGAHAGDRDDAKELAEMASPSCGLLRLPPELLLGVLQLLPSSEVVAVGNSCWSLHYLSAHPLLWQHLCERELPARADAEGTAAVSAAKSDWKREFLIRLQEKEKGKEREKVSAGRTAEVA